MSGCFSRLVFGLERRRRACLLFWSGRRLAICCRWYRSKIYTINETTHAIHSIRDDDSFLFALQVRALGLTWKP